MLDRLPGIVGKQIRRFGRPVTLTHTTPGAYDPGTDSMTGGVTTTLQTKALPWEFETREVDGTTIRVGDRRYLLSTDDLSAEPGQGWKLIDGEVTYQVLRSKPYEVGESTAAIEIHARK